MSTVSTVFKLTRPREFTRRVSFGERPDWLSLAAKIEELFNIPVANVAVSYVDEDGDEIILNTEEELEGLYGSMSEETTIKFTVHDLHARDAGCAGFLAPENAERLRERITEAVQNVVHDLGSRANDSTKPVTFDLDDVMHMFPRGRRGSGHHHHHHGPPPPHGFGGRGRGWHHHGGHPGPHGFDGVGHHGDRDFGHFHHHPPPSPPPGPPDVELPRPSWERDTSPQGRPIPLPRRLTPPLPPPPHGELPPPPSQHEVLQNFFTSLLSDRSRRQSPHGPPPPFPPPFPNFGHRAHREHRRRGHFGGPPPPPPPPVGMSPLPRDSSRSPSPAPNMGFNVEMPSPPSPMEGSPAPSTSGQPAHVHMRLGPLGDIRLGCTENCSEWVQVD